MQNGIYRLAYETATLNGGGVLALQDGSLNGCDRYYFIIGYYSREGNTLKGGATFKRRVERPGASEAGIPAAFTVSFEGLCSDKYGQFEIHSRDVPVIRGKATFTYLCEIT